ncbi:MAG: hypothetical protein XD63_0488 [Thermoanaerobacterales bacterium 50_218]|nr:MAG: hypothetical protein XD63_0488 [Thermoanaerobacterales bacterium 50_218]HAA89356.1 hypothetical protein [Peptococcaceae bacterium]
MCANQKGQALIIVLLFTALIFVVGETALAISTAVKRNSTREVYLTKAYYIAEAGVEKVLAKAKSNPGWVEDLGLDVSRDFLHDDLGGESSYAGGTFEKIYVTKINEENNVVTLEIESTGEFAGIAKTLTVVAEIEYVYSQDIFQGMWTMFLAGLKLAHGAKIVSETIASDGEMELSAGSYVYGNVYALTKVTLEDMQGNEVVFIEGDVYCAGYNVGEESSVLLGTGATLNNLYVQSGRVEIGENVKINGKIYVKDINQLDEEWRNNNPNKWEVQSDLDCLSLIPQYPDLLSDEKVRWYAQNADYVYQGPVTFNSSNLSDLSGIYYVDGDATFSGEYSGSAIFVVDGNVMFDEDLRRQDNDQDHCLAILSTGGFVTKKANLEIEALLYSRGSADVANKVFITGGMVVANIQSQGCEVEFTYDDIMVGQYVQNLNWTTCFIRITSWRE